MTLPPGRARLSTTHTATGLEITAKTIGTTAVAFFAATVAGTPDVMITSTLSRTSSTARSAQSRRYHYVGSSGDRRSKEGNCRRSKRLCRDFQPGRRVCRRQPGPTWWQRLPGLSNQSADLAATRLELLSEVVPGLRRLAIIADVEIPDPTLETEEIEAAGPALGLEVFTAKLRRAKDIKPAF